MSNLRAFAGFIAMLTASAAAAAPLNPIPAPERFEILPERPRPDKEGKIHGTIKSFDEEKGLLRVTVDGQDFDYRLADDYVALRSNGRPYPEETKMRIITRSNLSVTFRVKDDNNRATIAEIQLRLRRPPEPIPPAVKPV